MLAKLKVSKSRNRYNNYLMILTDRYALTEGFLV
jgi:hypothetical protein